jgi:hypothetical protein
MRIWKHTLPTLLVIGLLAGLLAGLKIIYFSSASQGRFCVPEERARPRPLATTTHRPLRSQPSFIHLLQAFSRSWQSADESALQQTLEDLLPVLLQRDVEATATWAVGQPASPWRSEVLRQASVTWAEKDLAAFRKWANKNLVEEEREDLLITGLSQVSRTNPAAAFAQALDCGLVNRHAAMEGFFHSWCREQADAATEWLKTNLSAADESLQAALIRGLTATDPTLAANLALESLQSEILQDEAIQLVIHHWAERDWDSALAWWQTFPHGALRDATGVQLAHLHKPPMP